MRHHDDQYRTYAVHEEPVYIYHTSNYSIPKYDYASTARFQESSGYGHSYGHSPLHTYSHWFEAYSSPRRSAKYEEQEGRHHRAASDRSYQERGSTHERGSSRRGEDYGYESPRGSPPPPYESDDYEERFYDERDRDAFYGDIRNSSKSKSYIYSRPAEEKASRSYARQDSNATGRQKVADTRSAGDPPKYRVQTKNTSHLKQMPEKSRTSFFSFGRKTSSAKQEPAQRPTTSTKSASRSQFDNTHSSNYRTATAFDAYVHSIPAGYSLKHWDPARRPILLLGSVFDCNTLGKWIYDWTVHRCGPMSAFADMAGELWILLIGLGGRCSRGDRWVAKATSSRSRTKSARHREEEEEDVEMVEEFLDAAERLWMRLEDILAACEEWMYRAARRSGARVDARTGRILEMGMDSGCEFVDSMFGRDRELETTEKLMASIRLWTMRFDRNVEDVILGG